MALAVTSTTDRVEQLIILTEKLTDIIVMEVGILKERRPKDLEPLAAEKVRFSKLYAREMALVNKDRTLIEGVKADLMATLKQATAKFRDALGEYQTILKAARTITEDMVHSIVGQVTDTHKPVVAYGRDVSLTKGGSDRPTALTFNEVV